ncbi:hypothetical protein B0H12DRAFT_1076979 [Mycena haematopus]|nr:hypothetical protein B0H12DRAFT_1076979 [Mycena haematopus]
MDVDNTPTRVEELWFEDGNLVVQAEQSLFRVYRAILAARSSVFNDMLGLTQPPDAELTDSAEDVTCFFRAIFDSSFFEPYPCKVSFEDALSITRLSHKYAVDYLFRRALVHLSHDFPTTLSAHDMGSETCSTNFGDIIVDGNLIPPTAAVIQLARQVNALWLLPMAFYLIASTDAKTIGHSFAAKLGLENFIRFLLTGRLHWKTKLCLRKAHDEARQPIWDKLPGICGLPSWPELEKMKADALEG